MTAAKKLQPMTAEQFKASDPDTSAWVAASAGTGKTHVLTNRVLRLLLEFDNPGGILSLTFTKAAAAEMESRINQRLARWAAASEADLREDLNALLDRLPDMDEMERARGLFAEVLDLPGGLKIQTIHSFCQSLMGRFPLEANIAPHTQVLDDHTGEALLQEAVNRTLVRAQGEGDTELGRALEKVSRLKADTELPDLIARLAHDRALVARAGGIEEMYRRLGLEPGETEADVVAAACADGAFDERALLDLADIMSGGQKTDQKCAAGISPWLTCDAQLRAQSFDEYVEAFLTQKGTIRAKLPTKGLSEKHPLIADTFLVEAERILRADTRRKLCRIAEASVALWILGHAFLDEYAALKRQRAVLDYDDLIEKARTLVTTAGNAAWVLYKLDDRVDHILVDEAQDTNHDQWAIVQALAEEFFTGLGSNERARTVFAVGDAKQSIYSFQRAEPEAFERTRVYFHERIRAVDKKLESSLLDLSFRSTQTVLDLVDNVFEAETAQSGLLFGAQDTKISHRAHRENIVGMVELWETEKPEETDAAERWAPPVQRRDVLPPPVRLARRISAQIREWLDNETELESRGRPIRPDDILILVRRRDSQHDEDSSFFYSVIRELKRRNIPVAGVDRMVLTEQLAVMDLMALGHFVLLPEDDLTLAVVLKSPLVGLTEDELFALAHGRTGSLWRALEERRDESETFRKTHDFLATCRAKADYMPPFEFFAGILDGGARREMVRRLGPDALDPLAEFLSLALDFERANPPSLQDFLHWVGVQETIVKREMEQGKGEVRVMTVHGAKGLEAPIVFLPDTCAVPQSSPPYFWLDEDSETPVLCWPVPAANRVGPAAEAYEAEKAAQIEEYNRQLYVAMTRAEDRLYVCGYETSQDPKDHAWHNLIRAGFEALGAEKAKGFDGQEVLRFRSGTEAGGEKEAEEPAGAQLPLPTWAHAAPLAEPRPSRPLAPSRPSEPEMPVRGPFDDEDRKRFQRGTLIHQLLQFLPDLPPADRAVAALRWLQNPAHDLTAEDAEAWAAEAVAVLADPMFHEVFEASSAAEVSVAGLLGTVAVSGQIDRLAVTSDSVLIVDYKTNRPPPARAAQVPALYLRQLATYRDLIRQIYPDKHVRCALLWTDGPALMPVEDDLLDPHSPLDSAEDVTMT